MIDEENDKKNLADQTENIQTDEMVNVKEEVPHSFFHKKCTHCEKHKKEAEEYKSGWQRAQADYQNLKTEVDKMRSEWVRMSEQQILEEYIPVYDNFKLAYRLRTADYKPEQQKWVDGIAYIMQQFWKIMQNHGVEEIKTKGEIFDPQFHEAIGEEESELPEHTIIREIETGYLMRGRVVKVAKVIVVKTIEN